MQRRDVLKDVRLAVGDQDHVELVQRLVNEADIVLLDRSVLRSGVCELGKGCQESLNSRPLHLTELPGENGFP